jgi:hypothetical protein
LFDDDDLGGDTKDDDETNYEMNDDQKSPFASKPNPQKASLDQKKRWRRSCKFDPNRVSQFWKLRGGHRVISLGGFLASQGAAWGELVVGKGLFQSPHTAGRDCPYNTDISFFTIRAAGGVAPGRVYLRHRVEYQTVVERRGDENG